MLLIRVIDSILTLDSMRRILNRHSVLIEDGKMVRVGETSTLDRDHLKTVHRISDPLKHCQSIGRWQDTGDLLARARQRNYGNVHLTHYFHHQQQITLSQDSLSVAAWRNLPRYATHWVKCLEKTNFCQ